MKTRRKLIPGQPRTKNYWKEMEKIWSENTLKTKMPEGSIFLNKK